MANAAPAAPGNGEAKFPIIEKRRYILEDTLRNRWFVTLPKDATRDSLGNPALYAAAPQGLARFDVLFVVAADESFAGEVLVLEPSATGLAAVKVLRLFDLPPRQQPGARGLHPDFRIFQGTLEQGLVVERKNKDGSRQVLAIGLDHPEWQGSFDKAEQWVRSHVTYGAA